MIRRLNTQEDIAEMLGVALRNSSVPGKPGAVLAVSTRKDLAVDLRSFGEDAVASEVLALSDAQFHDLYEIAGAKYLKEGGIVRSLCLAAVELVEGRQRPLTRKRRKRAT
jgi:hypothetical protein